MKKYFLFIFILISTLSCGQNWIWGREASPAQKNSFAENLGDHSVATDKDGNVYSVGAFSGALAFGNYSIKTSSNYGGDMFIVKYDANGNPIWVQQAVTASDTSASNAYSIALDASGNVYVAGSFVDTVSFGQNTLRTLFLTSQLFLVKYDATGHLLWAKQSTGPSRKSDAWGLSLAVDAVGNACIMGVFVDTVSFGPYTVRSTSPNEQMFVVKYDENGTILWANQDTPIGYGLATPGALAMDKANNIYISGTMQFGVTFGKFIFHDTNAVFMAKYGANGKLIWAKRIMDGQLQSFLRMQSMASDGQNNLYLTGYFSDSVSVGNSVLYSFEYDAFLAKYDSGGHTLWTEQAYFSSLRASWGGYSVACDTLNSGGGYLVFGNSEFVPPPDTMVFAKDTFLYKQNSGSATVLIQFDASGKVICGKEFPEAFTYSNNSVCVDKSGQYIYLANSLAIESAFGTDTLSNLNMPFIARWQLCGSTEGINEISSQKNSISLFPDPNNGQFTIDMVVETPCMASLQVYNMMGQKIFAETLQPQTPVRNGTGGPKGALSEIKIGNQPNGVYLYRVIDETGTLLGSGKFIIQK